MPLLTLLDVVGERVCLEMTHAAPPTETAVGLVLEGQSSVSTQDQSLKVGEFVH